MEASAIATDERLRGLSAAHALVLICIRRNRMDGSAARAREGRQESVAEEQHLPDLSTRCAMETYIHALAK